MTTPKNPNKWTACKRCSGHVAIYPKCSECGVSYVLRRMLSFTDGGYHWLWQSDCKHKKAEALIIDGATHEPLEQAAASA